MSSDRLEGAALVTGGGRGIGARIARELAAAGMHVGVTGRTRAQVEAIAGEIGGVPLVGDVSRREDVERWVAELGDIDVLVANAGIATWERRAWEEDPDEWWQVLEVNVLGVYLCCRAVIPGMIERGRGRIVITGSGASYLPGSLNSAYAASKAAVGRFGEALARQLEPHGIPVFVISPGLVRTDMTMEHFPTTHRGRRRSLRRGSCARWPRDAPTRSPAGTSTRSTTTSTISSRAPRRFAATT